MLDGQVRLAKMLLKIDVGMQLAWKSANESFSVAAGKVPNASRAITVDDTWLYGSGTKPVTAAAVMRLADEKKVSWSDKASKYIDPFLRRNNGTTLEALYGATMANATVLDLIRMSAGIPDYELANSSGKMADPCDTEVLTYPDRLYSPYWWMRYASNTSKGEPVCAASTCSAYSSTSYEVAGLLVAAVMYPNGDWSDLDLRTVALPDPNNSFPSLTFTSDKFKHLSDVLTVPGIVTNRLWPKKQIFDQNPSILGWTCGNMVGSTKDVASWFYDLLNPDTTNPKIVSDGARAEMMRLETLTAGWLKGYLKYGAGLMEQKLSQGTDVGPDDWAYAIGHDGQTFGFYSTNGYIPKGKAAFSIVVNTDGGTFLVQRASCRLRQLAAQANGETPGFRCGMEEDNIDTAYHSSPSTFV